MLGTIKRKQVEKYYKSPAAKREEIECNSYTILHQALENCKPIIGLASVQKGEKSSVLQVPVPLTDNRRTHRYEKLSQELLAAFTNEGNVVKRKRDLHKMAEANRAYAHYRWW